MRHALIGLTVATVAALAGCGGSNDSSGAAASAGAGASGGAAGSAGAAGVGGAGGTARSGRRIDRSQPRHELDGHRPDPARAGRRDDQVRRPPARQHRGSHRDALHRRSRAGSRTPHPLPLEGDDAAARALRLWTVPRDPERRRAAQSSSSGRTTTRVPEGRRPHVRRQPDGEGRGALHSTRAPPHSRARARIGIEGLPASKGAATRSSRARSGVLGHCARFKVPAGGASDTGVQFQAAIDGVSGLRADDPPAPPRHAGFQVWNSPKSKDVTTNPTPIADTTELGQPAALQARAGDTFTGGAGPQLPVRLGQPGIDGADLRREREPRRCAFSGCTTTRRTASTSASTGSARRGSAVNRGPSELDITLADASGCAASTRALDRGLDLRRLGGRQVHLEVDVEIAPRSVFFRATPCLPGRTVWPLCACAGTFEREPSPRGWARAPWRRDTPPRHGDGAESRWEIAGLRRKWRCGLDVSCKNQVARRAAGRRGAAP